jgi:hypothetical protein
MLTESKYKQLAARFNTDFYSAYSGIDLILHWSSYLGHVLSAFFSYYYLHQIVADVAAGHGVNSLIIDIPVIMLLIGLEFAKRFVLDRFSSEHVSANFKIKTSLLSLVISAIFLAGISSYMSIDGAGRLAQTGDKLEVRSTQDIKTLSDSIINVRNKDLLKLEEEAKRLDLLSISRADQVSQIKNKTARDLAAEQAREASIRAKDARNRVDSFNIKTEKELVLLKNNINANKEKEVLKSDGNSFKFYIISGIIELVIIIGVWFRRFYNWKSKEDYKKLVCNTENYKRWNVTQWVLDVFHSSKGDLPSSKKIKELANATGKYLTQSEIDQSIKVLTHLECVKTQGNRRKIMTDKETSDKYISDYYNIKL